MDGIRSTDNRQGIQHMVGSLDCRNFIVLDSQLIISTPYRIKLGGNIRTFDKARI